MAPTTNQPSKMLYRKMRKPCPSPFFELQVKTILARLALRYFQVVPPPHLMRGLEFYISATLIAEKLPPRNNCVVLLLEKLSDLLALARGDQPILYKKRNSLALMFDGISIQSEMNLDDPDDLVLAYTQSMMGFLLFKPEPERIGMIGLGGGSLAKFCYRHLPGSIISVAEIDRKVIDLRDQFFVPRDDERFNVACVDGAEFVRRANGEFDVLLVDGFDNDGQPAQLCSHRFYQDCHRALAPDGLMVVNLLGGDLWQTDIYVDRMRSSFGDSVIAINALDSLNMIAFAAKGDAMKLDREILQKRMLQLTALRPVILRATAQRILAEQKAINLRKKAACAK